MENETPVVHTTPIPPEHPTKSPGLKISLIILAVVIVGAAGAAGYFYRKELGALFFKPKPDLTTPTTTISTVPTTTVQIPTTTPVVLPTSTEFGTLEKELPDVINNKDFEFSPAVKNLLLKNNFAVVPNDHREFFPVYEANRYNKTPSFITTDSILHNYHLMFDYLLKDLEEQRLANDLSALNKSLLPQVEKQYTSLKGTAWQNAAKRNVGFFNVGSKLLDPTTKVNTIVATEVNKELALISEHSTIDASPLMNLGSSSKTGEANKEDYSQYVPRGHYTKSDLLKNYFKSMMWYGRMSFRFKSEDEVRSAVLITLLLNEKNNQTNWQNIYEPTSFMVGKSDDVTYAQLNTLIEEVYGKNPSLQTITKDTALFAKLMQKTKTLEPPQINSIPVFNAAINPDRENEIKAFRFMGQRFTIDAAVFQRLIEREVQGRMLPTALDFPAAMGSVEALAIIDANKQAEAPEYKENITKLQKYFAGLNQDTWTQNLYWGWVYALQPLLLDRNMQEKSTSDPIFMKNQAWVRKDLNTFLGSWTELKHDTILYAKQSYAEMGGDPGNEVVKDDRGYVEPNTNVYYRLVGLIRKTRSGLLERKLLSPKQTELLDNMDTLALSLKNISEKQLNNTPLTDAEYEIIRSYGGQLEHLWYEVNKNEIQKGTATQSEYLDQNPAALVADIATDPNGSVLEVGTGHISEIYVLVPIDRKLRIAKGAVYSYYEFTAPRANRLTDEKWRKILMSDDAPNLPKWTELFTASNLNK
jgi:hypothetical protein